jgi:hypothetical protein
MPSTLWKVRHSERQLARERGDVSRVRVAALMFFMSFTMFSAVLVLRGVWVAFGQLSRRELIQV